MNMLCYTVLQNNYRILTYQSGVSNKTCCIVSLLAAAGRLLFWLAVILKLGQTRPEEQTQLLYVWAAAK